MHVRVTLAEISEIAVSIVNDQFDYHMLHHKAGWITSERDDISNDYVNQALWQKSNVLRYTQYCSMEYRWCRTTIKSTDNLSAINQNDNYAYHSYIYKRYSLHIACENVHGLLIMKPGNFHRIPYLTMPCKDHLIKTKWELT